MSLRRTARRMVFCGLVLAVVVLGAPAGLLAQEDAQRCEGTVTDADGNPLAGVKITFLDVEKGREAQPVKTNKKGGYAHNVLRTATSPGYEIRAELEGYLIVQITALTQRQDGTRATDETYMVGQDQEGLHKVAVVPQSRSDIRSRGLCQVDFVLAPEERFAEVFHALREKQGETASEGGTAPAAATGAPSAPPAPGMPPAAAAAPSAGRTPLQQAQAKIAEGDWVGAVEPARKATASTPDSAEAHRWLGGALLRAKNLPEAETELKQALQLDPTFVGANFDMGMLYVEKGRLMQAIPFFEKELELIPDSVSVLQNLGKLYTDTEQHDKAIATYEKLIALEPNSVEFYGQLADAYKQSGNTQKELETYRKMGAQDPTGMAFYNLGNLMFNKSEMQQAASAYEKAIQQAPDNAMAHYQLGMTYVNLGKFKEAATSLDAFVKLKPKDPKAAEAKSLAVELRKLAGG